MIHNQFVNRHISYFTNILLFDENFFIKDFVQLLIEIDAKMKCTYSKL
uniref:Uncharacterized protein n=1 Tax=Rhizophora mucronata TaxID=61149 RepID=A0A2P2MY95_RHIMU